MKQAPAGSFAVWSSCLLQREGLPFVDAVVWGFWGNWFLYLPDLLGGDLLWDLVQAVEFTEKSMPRGWVGFFSLPGLFFMCKLTRRQPANVAFRATPNSAQNRKPCCVSTSDEGLVKTMQWYIPSAVDDMDHLLKWLPGAQPEAAPLNGNPIFWALQVPLSRTDSKLPPQGAFPNRQLYRQERQDGLLQRTNWHKKGTYNKFTHTQKKIIYIYIYICGEKCVFKDIFGKNICSSLCRKDVVVCEMWKISNVRHWGTLQNWCFLR